MLKKVWSTLFEVLNILGPKKGYQKMFGQKDFGSKKIWSEKVWVQRNMCVQNILGLKKFWVKKNFGPKRLKPQQNWVKIGTGTTELFMICKKVAWTNVTVTVGIC